MEILKQALLDFFKKKSNIDLKDIKRELKINSSAEEELLKKCLYELEVDAILYQDKEGRYSPLANKTKIMQGVVHFKPNGDAFVITKDNYKIIIPKEKTDGLLNKDIITVNNLLIDRKNNVYGTVEKIIKRNLSQISCEVVFKDGKNTLIPYNSTNKTIIHVEQRILDKYGVGELLLVNLEKDGIHDGEIIKDIGHKDEPDVDEKTIAYDHGFNIEYSNKYLKEIEKIPSKIDVEKSVKEHRVDLRDKLLFTIDGKDTKDIDDAVCLEKLPNGNYKLYVSIADVSYYVKEGTAIYEEAYERGTSVYMNDTVIHMLHPKLSNGICSLHQGVDRLTKTCEMVISPEGKVLNYDIYFSIINSKKKMNYDNVNKIVMDNEHVEGYEEFEENLKLMNELSQILTKQKIKRGYLSFSKEDIKAKGQGNNITFEKREQKDAEQIIENFMLLANESVGEFFMYSGLPGIYRVHESPDEDRVSNFVTMLNEQGFNFKNCKSVTSNKYMQNLIKCILSEEQLDNEIYSELLLMSTMKRAKYSNINIGHYGLALKAYIQFTSPIRRFPDLKTHQLLDLFIKVKNFDYSKLDDLSKYLGEISTHCTERSVEADRAERDARQMRMAEFMEQHIGEEFIGTVSYVGQRYLSVKLDNGITGMLNYSDLTDDKYIYDERYNKIIGKNTGNEYGLGSKINFVVKDASKKNRTITLASGPNIAIDKHKVYKKNIKK